MARAGGDGYLWYSDGAAARTRIALYARLGRSPLPFLAAALGLAGCAVPVLPGCEQSPAFVAWVVNYGWHTEIILPAAALTGPLASLRSPGATALSFGFGKLDFITVPVPEFGDFAKGAIPGPAAVRVVTLHVPPAASTSNPLTRLPLTRESLTELEQFLSDAIERGPDGQPVIAAAPPDADTRFYAATHGYSLVYTCNTWAADGLQQAGFSMGNGIVFSSGVMHAVARLRGACEAG